MIIKDQCTTKKRAVYVHDVATALNKLLEAIKRIDGTTWTIEKETIADEERSAFEETL